jgi:Na+/H+-translocating membrane pyrophosphatase
MLGANGSGTLAAAVGQIAALSTGYSSVIIAGQGRMSIASLAKSWSGQNVTIGQSGVGTQLIDGFINIAYAMLVAIGLVYLLVAVLVTFFALLLVIIGGFISLAATGHASNIITGLAVSLQAEVLPVTVIAAGTCFTYSVGDGLYDVALATAVMRTIAAIVVVVWTR